MAERLPLAVPPDADGPRVRLGLLWFTVSVGAASTSQLLLAAVMAAAAGLAADEVVRVHLGLARSEGSVWAHLTALLVDPTRLVVVVGTAALPLLATAGTDTLTAGLAGVILLVFVHRLVTPTAGPAVAHLGLVVLAVLAIGITAAMPVLLAEIGTSAAAVLLVLVCAYDTGNFLVGTGAAKPWEGPVAGVAAVAVCGFAAWVLAFGPLEADGTLAVAAVTAALAPLGAPAASVLIGDGRRSARFVRRLDSLLVVGPVAVWTAAAVVG